MQSIKPQVWGPPECGALRDYTGHILMKSGPAMWFTPHPLLPPGLCSDVQMLSERCPLTILYKIANHLPNLPHSVSPSLSLFFSIDFVTTQYLFY